MGAIAALASSVVVILGLVSAPMASATPYQGHAVAGATKSSLVSPHTPPDSAAPLNLVYSETFLGDAAPYILTQTPTQPVFPLNDPHQLFVSWPSGGQVQVKLSSPIVAGQTYDNSNAIITIGGGANPFLCQSADGDDTEVTVDQLVAVGTTIQTLALQYDCLSADGNTELVGTIAYNASPSTPGQGYYLYGAAGELGGFGNDEFSNYLGDLTTFNLNQPIVGMATTPSDGGYWMVATDGGIFSYGDANFYGSTGGIPSEQAHRGHGGYA